MQHLNIPSIGRIPEPKKKARVESIDDFNETLYTYGAAICHLSPEPSSVVRFYCKKMIPESVLFRDIDSGIDGYEPNPHVTVKYGFLDDANKVADVCEGFGQFPIELGLVDKFDTNPDFDVIMVRVNSEKLEALNHLLGKYCRTEDPFNDFQPHATLAYVNKGTCDHLIGDKFFVGLDDMIDVVYFSDKNGIEHPINL